MGATRETAALIRTFFAAAALALAAEAALAQTAAQRVDAFDSLVRCRQIADSTQRLACFDAAAARLEQAEKSGDVVVVDRAQVREARKSAFGFSFEGFKLFDRGEKAEPALERVELVLERASQGRDGKWVFHTADGQVWRQVDREPLNRTPKKGARLEVRTAALGSFFMNVDGQRALRVRREK